MSDIALKPTAANAQLMIDKVTKKFKKWTWLVGLAAVLVLAPMIWMLVYAMLGVALLGLSVILTGLIIAAITYGTPVFLMKAKNMQINAIIAEATKNPIPTLRAEWEEDKKDIDAFDESITEYDGKIQAVEGKIQKLSARLTPDDIARMNGEVAEMRADLEGQIKDLEELRAKLKVFATNIDRAEAIYEIGQSMKEASAANRLAHHDDLISKIKRETAYDSVISEISEGKARMRQRIRTRRHDDSVQNQPTGQITNNPSDVIEMPAVPARGQTSSFVHYDDAAIQQPFKQKQDR